MGSLFGAAKIRTSFKKVTDVNRGMGLRYAALFLLTAFWTSILVPSASAVGAIYQDAQASESLQIETGNASDAVSPDRKNKHIKPLEEEANTEEDTFQPTKGLPQEKSKTKNAADNEPSMTSPIPGLPGATNKQQTPLGEAVQSPNAKQSFKTEELVSKRTANSTTSRNKDGSLTTKLYNSAQFFKDEGKWKDIDTTLVEDKNAGDSGHIAGKILGNVESIFKEETTFIVKENNWRVRFAPSDAEQGMVRVKQGDSQIGFSPVNAAKVNPIITTDAHGEQTVHYYNLWPGVDVEYAVLSSELKENIVIKNKNATSDFSFKLTGASLKKQGKSDQKGSPYTIDGALDDNFAIAPFTIILNKYGLEANQPVTHSYKNNKLNISVDKDYLQDLPKDAYPVIVDPTIHNQQSTFGNRAGGNYGSLKSDGYICDSTICNPLAGAVQDTQGIWRSWRGVIYADYSFLKGQQLNAASLHLTQRLGLSTSGTTAAKNFDTWYAPCTDDFGCKGIHGGSASITTSGDIDVKPIYQDRMNANVWNAWLMITGEELNAVTYKNWDPDNSYVTFNYQDVLPSPDITNITNGQVFIDPQVSFISTTGVNPINNVPLQYVFCVSTGTDCAGAVIVSSPQASAQWTVPDGMLDDGTTYYVSVRGYDPTTNVYGTYGVAKSFRIDSRTGKDTTQAFDTLGPVSVDLATGNLTTSASSHTSSALGGSLGVSLDYNSPMRSRNGLVGSYWNNTAFSGSPTLTRVDSQINFDWRDGSPASNVINNDSFSARWEGYFVAPTTGSYTFGGVHDDGFKVYIDNTVVYDNNTILGSIDYTGATAVSLTAGQVVPIKVEFYESPGQANAKLYVKGAVAEQVVPNSWLQTGARALKQDYGLTGRYYKDTGDHDFSNSANSLMMQRNDSSLNFAWGLGSPVPGGQTDNFLVRWTGWVTVPTTGSYTFGTASDDGSRITIGNDNTQVFNKWNDDGGALAWGSAYNLTANVPTPITIDYFEHGGAATMSLWVKNTSAGINDQVVPSSWLSSSARVLPSGWSLGVDPDGNTSYDHIKVMQSSVVLSDSTGSTHEYKWDANKGSYTPPVNEDGKLVRNGDGTYTFQDTDGRTYIFNTDGSIKSITSPVDDAKPAALQYSYGGTPTKLTQITDGVTPDRWMKLFYSGSTECAVPPSGFDAAPPANMLCAAKTNDGRATSFFYKNGRLARIVEPGNEITDYGYDTDGRIVSIRDPLANDAIGASVRADDTTANTSIEYDNLGRLKSVTQPAATTGANRTQHTLNYYPGNGTYFGATEQHVTGATEPNGYTRRIEYDNLLRTTTDADIAGLSDTTVWDAAKDLVLSTTDETGLMSTTIYDDEDRPVTNYGPAPAAWYGTDRKPLTTYASQVPRTDTAFDENMQGPSVTYYEYSTTTKSLTGAPKMHSTSLPGAANGEFSKYYTSSPIPGVSDNWGFRATGKLRLPTTGTYIFRLYSDNGVRLYFDGKLALEDWNDGVQRNHPGSFYEIPLNNTAGTVHDIKIEYYHRTGDANFELHMTPPGGSETSAVNQYISPDYSLTTSTKTYDSALGDSTTTTNYGSNPELGLAQSTSVDPTGLNLTTNSTFETQGATGSFLRQTSKTLPGNSSSNPSFSYAYYGATETRDNPCTTGTTETYKQAGMLKIKTEADPDGTGSQTGRATETIYDDTGRVVATRYNSDSWTCTTYDSRGRVSQTIVPAYNGADARTTSNDYAVGGNPLVTTTWDDQGWIVTWADLLGRTTKYRDVHDDETTSTYDDFGKLTQRVSPLGTETFVYDSYNRLTEQKLDSVTYATVSYDSYGRIDHVDYNNASQLRLTLGRDSLGRTNTMTYRMGDGTTTVSDTVNRTQSGQIINDIVASGSNELWYTYGYDGADRLTSANIGPHTYTYGYGTQDAATCGTGNDTNPNSGKNGNRTSQTVNGVTTYFCYDYADRLTGSTNALYNGGDIDSHGNMTSVGSGSTPLRLCYDSSDRNTCMTQRDSSGTGVAMYYNRDVQGRIVARFKNTLTNWNATAAGDYWYGFTGSGDTPDFVRGANWDVIEKTLQLPGGVNVTIKPAQIGNAQKEYSLPNIHGDTLLTTNAAGTNTSNGNGPLNAFTYDPFGNVLAGSSLPSNTADGSASYGYVGQHEKLTESGFALTPIQMGARVYIPGIGRFLQVDPVEGGVDNNYVYPTDPVGEFDLTGEWASWAKSAWKWVGKNGDKISGVAAGISFGACIVASGGACLAIAGAAAAVGGITTTAKARRSGSTWGKALTMGSIDTAIGASGLRGIKAVRWFGDSRNYRSLATALSKKTGVKRLVRLSRDQVTNYARGKAMEWGWNRYTKKWR